MSKPEEDSVKLLDRIGEAGNNNRACKNVKIS